jgi:hypothetical protein
MKTETLAPLQTRGGGDLGGTGRVEGVRALPAATYGAKVCWGTASEAVERRNKTVG